jgi:LuxR family maltose regulon positive regulatory protein
MTDGSTSVSLLKTKLHRPALYGDHIYRQRLLDQLDQRENRPLILISAPAGYGKTVLASCWLEASDSPSAWVSLDDTDNDLRLFLSYFLAAIQTIFPNFGRETQTLVNASTLAPVSILADSLISEIDRVEQSFILALDDFHVIKDKFVLDLFSELLRHPPQLLHLVLICRRDPYLPISALRARRFLTEIRTQDLRFSKTEIEELLGHMLGTEVDPSTAAALSEKTEGWVTGLLLAVFSLRQQGRLDPALLEPQVDAQYVMEYFFTEVFSHQPQEITLYLMSSAILNRFCAPLCEAVRLPDGDSPTSKIGGWDFIAWLKEQNLFLIDLDNEKRWFRFHHLFQKLLHNQLKRHFSRDDINALHNRASKWFAENGLIEEALKHALAGGHPETAGQLICKHGFDLLNEMEWSRLQRWLGMLPDDMVERKPELLVLVSWLHVIFSRFTELRTCLHKAESLYTTPAFAKHVAGHIDALNAFQSNVAADGEHSLMCARRALKELPRDHHWPRIHTLLLKASAHQMLGDIEKAHAAIETQLRHIRMSSGVSKSHFQANQCYIHWMQADLTGVLQAAEGALKTAKDFQEHQASYQALYFKGIAHFVRNELQVAEDMLVSVIKEPYAQHALNFAHSAFALALIHQALGRADEANEIGETVVSFGVHTSHPGVIKLARAFHAELALRQGRLAEASLWAEQFVAKPFTLMYRVYIPQLTLVKVMMAQDTGASREQAADLLKQLYDFVTSSHNRRFQIDVLALQSLLYDSQGEGTAALESLTHALQLAEPSGFIRPFVDLGSSMADLLKRLHWKRIARGYIEKILAAFEQEGDQAVLPKADGRPTASARQPQSPSPLSPPLVEPLTNRELDVLELLAQRLSNKEIADKLFISAETVKGHLQNIYQKLEVKKRREAVEKAKRIGIL